MSIRFDLKKLPDSTKKRLVRTIKGFRKMYPNIELVLIDKAPGVMRACEYQDFNIILFMGEELYCNRQNKEVIQTPLNFNEYQFRIEVINSYHPGSAYRKVERIPEESEAKLFSVNDYRVGSSERGELLKYLYHNLFYYADRGKGDMSSVTTINVPAAKRDNPKFYHLYRTNLLERGYMAFHRELKTVPFIDFPRGYKSIPKALRKK